MTPEQIHLTQAFRSASDLDYSRQTSSHATTPMHSLVDEIPPSYCRVAPGGDLPPPPPSPPLSQKTSLTNRSRGSSCKNSEAERQSSHSRERARRARNPIASHSVTSSGRVSSGRPTDTDTGIDSPQQTPSPPRPNDLRLNQSYQHQVPVRQHNSGMAYKQPQQVDQYNRPQNKHQKPRRSGIALQYA